MRWSEDELRELMHAIVNADQLSLAMWVIDHVGVDEAAWDDLATAVASMAATAFVTITHAELGDGDGEIIYQPMHPEDAEPVIRDAGLLVTMQTITDAQVEAAGMVLYEKWSEWDRDEPYAAGHIQLVRDALEAARDAS